MQTSFYVFIALMFLVRLTLWAFSRKNELKLKKEGAKEYGTFVTLLLFLVHLGFYVLCIIEGYRNQVQFSTLTVIGFIIYGISCLFLALVVYQIRDVWSFKILIAKNHHLVKSWLFTYIKHPNYFLGNIPELIGVALVFRGWMTLEFLMPVYLILIVIRIVQEEKAMKMKFANY